MVRTSPRMNAIRPAKGRRRHMRPVIGWRERVDLPEIGIFGLKAKIDTGARTSALHVEHVEEFTDPDGAPWLRFEIPIGNGDEPVHMVACEVPSGGVRRVKSSTGHLQRRRVIRTPVRIGDYEVEIDITLADRNAMLHPMLLGRTALRNHFLINPGRSFLLTDKGARTRKGFGHTDEFSARKFEPIGDDR